MDLPHSQDGFDAFYTTYRSLVYAAAMKLIHDCSDAEDLVQVVFLKVWMSPDAFRGGNIESWLTTVTKNATLDRMRRQLRERQFAFETSVVRECAKSVEDEALGNVLQCAVACAIGELDEGRRAAMLAAFIENQTYSAIALASAIPLGTVKTRIRSGIAELRRRFREAS